MPWFIVGANHGNSDFTVSVEREEHHACVTLHASLVARRVELAHFTAEADKVYYYCTQLVMSRSVELLELEPVDSDQGKHLVAPFRGVFQASRGSEMGAIQRHVACLTGAPRTTWPRWQNCPALN
jgi:hypothetical protein